jgi:hypothetical protein
MRFSQLAILAAFAGLWTNCSNISNGTPNEDASNVSTCDPLRDADVTDGGATLDGPAYPTTNVGGQVGQIFPNLTLAGVRSAVTVTTSAMVSMAEYYDPDGLQYDLLHITGILMWCPHCKSETSSLAKIAAWQSEHRVAAIQIVLQGSTGASPGWCELQAWVSNYNLNFPVVVDGQGAQLGQYFTIDYVPLNIVVNPRSMEILAVDVGDVGDVQAYEQGFLSSL